jgi:hypothetical protein
LPALPGRRSGDKFTTHGLRGGFFLLCKKPRNPPRPDPVLKPYTRLTIQDLKKTHEKTHPRERDAD